MPVTIIALFYLYTSFTRDALIWDITIFVIAVIIGQSASYLLLKHRSLPGWTGIFGMIVLLLLTAVFASLTYFPPHIPLFQDPVLGGYSF